MCHDTMCIAHSLASFSHHLFYCKIYDKLPLKSQLRCSDHTILSHMAFATSILLYLMS